MRIRHTGMMSDLFSLFDETGQESATASQAPLMMSEDQRQEIRALFGTLGIATAREQFAVIEELTGTRIGSVSELSATLAHRSIDGLRRRIRTQSETRTGNSWDDRDEDTWIDRL